MLNDIQAKAVNSDSNKILLLAGAGSGKTYCMLERIKRLINDGVDPNSILVLTFTNAAAFNMNHNKLLLFHLQGKHIFVTGTLL